MSKKLCDKPVVHSLADSNKVFLNCGQEVKQMPIDEFRNHLNDNDNQVLNDLAFYIDINTASSKGSTRVDVGGNDHMRAIWENSKIPVLMTKNGDYTRLNRSDCRYTADGESIVDSTTGQLLSKWANCDVVIIIPEYYGHVQTVTVGATTKLLPWFSLMPLPNGYIIPQQVVGKFKATLINGALRSIPGYAPQGSYTINQFWNYAQARSKNHGLANMDFRNDLLFHMMSKYGWRDSQNCQTVDGTPVWGVGLDGTENSGGWSAQSGIKMGATLSLGMSDGKSQITDTAGNTCHKVNVEGFEDPWGQLWEMVQGICSVGTDVYVWRSNWLPTGTPTAASFSNVDHVVVTRASSDGVTLMNIVAEAGGQGVVMIPKQSVSGISYGDYFWYSASGQLWLFGGRSDYGSSCGLAFAFSDNVWSDSFSYISARLAYYGDVREVSSTRLAELAAAA